MSILEPGVGLIGVSYDCGEDAEKGTPLNLQDLVILLVPFILAS